MAFFITFVVYVGLICFWDFVASVLFSAKRFKKKTIILLAFFLATANSLFVPQSAPHIVLSSQTIQIFIH
jgi:hypothetical protein